MKKLFAILFLMHVLCQVNGQPPIWTFAFENPIDFNPALIHQSAHVWDSRVNARQYHTGLDNHFQSTSISADGYDPFNKKNSENKLGFGALLSNDRAGMANVRDVIGVRGESTYNLTTTRLLFGASWKPLAIRCERRTRLSFGLAAGFAFNSLQLGSNSTFGDQFDGISGFNNKTNEAIPSLSRKANFQFIVGGLYRRRRTIFSNHKYYLNTGASVGSLSRGNNIFFFSQTAPVGESTLPLLGSAYLKFDSLPFHGMKISPYVIFRNYFYPSNAFKSMSYALDLGADLHVSSIIDIGMMYRGILMKANTDVLALRVKYTTPITNLKVGYSAEMITNNISKNSNYSHELFVSYSFYSEKHKQLPCPCLLKSEVEKKSNNYNSIQHQ